MSDVHPSPTREEFLRKSFTDAATFCGGVGLCLVSHVVLGPVGVAVASALSLLPVVYSGFSGMARVIGDPASDIYHEIAGKTGLQLTGEALKNAAKTPFNAAILALSLVAAGSGVYAVSQSLETAKEQNAARHSEAQQHPRNIV